MQEYIQSKSEGFGGHGEGRAYSDAQQEDAGLQVKDLILRVNGKTVDGASETC